MSNYDQTLTQPANLNTTTDAVRRSHHTEGNEATLPQRNSNNTNKEKKTRFDLTYDPSDDENEAKKTAAAGGATTRRDLKENRSPVASENITGGLAAAAAKKSTLKSVISPRSRSRSKKRSSGQPTTSTSAIGNVSSPK